MKEFTHDGEPITKALASLNHQRPASLAGLAVCITGIVPGFKGHQAEDAAERRGARTTKNVSSRTALLVIGHNAGRDKLDRAERWNTPTITAREFLALI
jgi:replication factor C subunit 1